MLTTKELIVAIPAFVGMALGIYNFVRDILKSRVNLQVIPQSVTAFGKDQENTVYKYSPYSFDPKEMSEYVAIEVVNKGAVPVTIDSVGFLAKGEQKPLVIYKPRPVDGGIWPRRLESREAVTVLGNLPAVLKSEKSKNITAAYAKTHCGAIRKGSSKALTAIIEFAKNA